MELSDKIIFGGYSKWKNRSSDKQGIKDYNLLTNAA